MEARALTKVCLWVSCHLFTGVYLDAPQLAEVDSRLLLAQTLVSEAHSMRLSCVICLLILSGLLSHLNEPLPATEPLFIIWFSKTGFPWVALAILCRPGWLTEVQDLPASASRVLGLKACTTTSCSKNVSLKNSF